ncbi:MAG: DUF2911 domain-containing protein [Chitinophagaceae bacterium]
MKRILSVLMIVCTLHVCSNGQALRTPSPSPAQTIKQDFGLSSIELSYSRPSAKGRKVFGDLVPFGNVWRTGANQATVLTFGEEVNIGGTKVPAGKYGLLTIPNKDNWTIILTKQLDVTSPAAYKMENDVVRVTAKTSQVSNFYETFGMQFHNVKANTCDLRMVWENTAVILPISTDIETKVMAQIDNLMNKDNRPYFAAASYYYDNGKDMKKAKEWAQKAVDSNPKAYWMVHLLAKIQAKEGDKTNAMASANKSIALAKEAKNEDYVALNEKLLTSLK